MQIVVASTYVPFIKGGGTMIVGSLAEKLNLAGKRTEKVLIPFRSYWQDISGQTAALRMLDLSEAAGSKIDRLITIRYPSYAIPHANKVAWFIHHHRGAYDLWGTEYQDIPNTEEGFRFRENLVISDTAYLRECKHVFTNSKSVSDRLLKFNNIIVDEVLYPPLPNSQLYKPGESGNYFLYSSRIVPIKRQTLLIEAMRHVKSDFNLILVGTSDQAEYGEKLKNLVSKYHLENRITFTGWISEEKKAEITSNAFAVLYMAFDEDSYGYSTLEGFHCGKPVITLKDSGATNEVITDGMNGYISDPSPEAIAEKMEKLWSNKDAAIELGKNSLNTLLRYNISWDHVIEVITA